MSPHEAIARLRQLENSKGWYARFSKGEEAEVAEWRALNEAIAQPAASPTVAAPETARAKIDALLQDRGFYLRLRDGEPDAIRLWQDLDAAVAGLPT